MDDVFAAPKMLGLMVLGVIALAGLFYLVYWWIGSNKDE